MTFGASMLSQKRYLRLAKLVAYPENGNLRGDLIEVTASYTKQKIPDAAMPLVRAVAEWTSRGDFPNAATVETTLPPSPEKSSDGGKK